MTVFLSRQITPRLRMEAIADQVHAAAKGADSLAGALVLARHAYRAVAATACNVALVFGPFAKLNSQRLSDVVARVDYRSLLRGASLELLRTLAAMVGGKLAQGAAQNEIAKYAPLVGAVGVAAYVSLRHAKGGPDGHEPVRQQHRQADIGSHMRRLA